MEPLEEYLARLDGRMLVRLGDDAYDAFVPAAIIATMGDDKAIHEASMAYVGINYIHNEMIARGLRAEARSLFTRINSTVHLVTGDEIMSVSDYEERYTF